MKVRTPPKAPRGKSGLLARAGRALYNDNYITALGGMLARNPRTIRHYLDGNSPIPDDRWHILATAIDMRIRELQRVQKELENGAT